MVYKRKPQHDSIKNIREKEILRRPDLDAGSLNAFSLAVGGTVTAAKELFLNAVAITICNTHASLPLLFNLTATSTTGDSDFIMFKNVNIPSGVTLVLEGREIEVISKPGEGYKLTFNIAAGAGGGTPGCDILLKT